MKNVVLYYHRVRNKQLRLIIREVDDKAKAKMLAYLFLHSAMNQKKKK